MDMKIKNGVALTSMVNYLEANVPQVGQVIVKFLIFKELGWLCSIDVEQAVRLFEEVVRPAMAAGVGINLSSERNRETYVSPFDTPAFNPDYGLEVSDVTTDRIGEWLSRAAMCTGEISELEAIAADGEFAARFYSEKSIDSAKKLIVLPYTEFIDSLPSILMGREKEDYQFNCKVNWKSPKTKSTQQNRGCVSVKEDRVEYHYMVESFTKRNGEKIPKIWDRFQDVRVTQIPDVAAYSLRRSKVGQVMPRELFAICHAAGNSKAGRIAKDLFAMIINMYRTATSSREGALKMARQEIKNLPMKLSDKEEQQLLKEVKEVISDLFGEVYISLTSMLRRASSKVSPVERCSIMVDLIEEEAEKDQKDEVSFKILADLLPEEYIIWTIDMSHRFGWNVCDYVEKSIKNQGMTEGDVVTFYKGVATYVDHTGVERTAVADDMKFSGDNWTIAFNDADDHWVARKLVSEFLAPPEPEDVVCFLTKSYKVEARPVFEKLKKEFLGHEVRLGFNDQGNYFFIDRKPIARWANWTDNNGIGNSGKTFLVKEAFYSKFNSGVLRDVIISDYEYKGKKLFRAFVIMEKPQAKDNSPVERVAPLVADSLIATK